MQLIKRVTLLYQEGRSDKVYEVDLCQIGGDRHVVNFRYGRRGTTLKEGVETEQAVTLAEAERIFAKLVQSKTSKGYRDATAEVDVGSDINTATAAVASPSAPDLSVGDPQKQAILDRLAQPYKRNSKWKLERAIWRAGELKIAQSVPLLVSLLGTGDALRDYCIAAALGWCGDRSVIPSLEQIYRNPQTPEFVQRIAWEAMYKLADEREAIALKAEVRQQLPVELQRAIDADSADRLQVLQTYWQNGGPERYAVLDLIYQIDSPEWRSPLLAWLRTAPLRPNTFKPMRHIFKMAEYRLDGEVFGVIAYRLEKEAAMYSSNPYCIRLPDGQYIQDRDYQYDEQTRRWEAVSMGRLTQELQSSNARVAYSDKTRDYLRQRVWRTLRKLGEAGDPAYTRMAAGVLLAFSDADAQPVRQSIFYRWDRQTWQRLPVVTIDWDIYAPYLPFNHVLYTNSSRYEFKLNSRAWRCRSPYKPGDPPPQVREEAFPQLWSQHPEDLLQLLLRSQCAPVHEFACKAIADNREFLSQVSLDDLIKLLESRYAITANLGFELIRDRYQPDRPDLQLAIAVVNCSLPEARAEAFRWIQMQWDFFAADSQFVASLITSRYADTRQFARTLLSTTRLEQQFTLAVIGRVISILINIDSTQAETVPDIGQTLLGHFAPQLRSLGFGIIRDLLQHPVLEVQELGVRILVDRETSAVDLPPGTIDSLINSPHNSIRVLGIQLFGQLPDEILLERDRLLLTMTVHELAEIREAIRPVISRLGNNHPDFGLRFASVLIDMLMTEEEREGIHGHIMRVLQTDLTAWQSNATQSIAMDLVNSKSPAGQELGGNVLERNADRWAETFDTMDIVQLGDREILSIRRAAWQLLAQIVARLRQNTTELSVAMKILESHWQDSREFGDRLFAAFSPDDFTPAVLVSLCDSNRPDVRKFGRDLIGRCFQTADGQEYLIKFSEHPAADMQLYATNYLEEYAVDNLSYLQALAPYFIRALSQVNRGRVAKRRIFAFLAKEAQKSEAAAQIIAEILTRQSATIAIGDKAVAIEILLKIHHTYPQIPVPIKAIAVPQR
ncbi:WGR domain-containing protein [Pseudanabaena sp. PCC 6802]|uniref:WGR domain-containing protein n=1 Tax=Pseudanabaena sp. PCC 6802 TaxID=118173 RepID=UPI00034D27E0|nr:WGR domain-containing protein [Pseudanabaena sp. PCC 6802]